MPKSPFDGIVPAAVGPYVACLCRPDGTTEVVSATSAIDAAMAMLTLLLEFKSAEVLANGELEGLD